MQPAQQLFEARGPLLGVQLITICHEGNLPSGFDPAGQ
jgi:hypothetical protein